MNKRKYFIAFSLAGIGAINAFTSVSAASLPAGTPTAIRDKVRADIKRAIINDDYQTFVAATKNSKAVVATITEAQFNAIVQAQRLRVSGDVSGAKKILSDAGVKPPKLGSKAKLGDL